jgi:NTE family protein
VDDRPARRAAGDRESLVGTSAGAIVAASLAAGRAPARPSKIDTSGETGHQSPDSHPQDDYRATARSRARGLRDAAARQLVGAARAGADPLAPLALAAGRPGGALLRAALLTRAPRGASSLVSLAESVRDARVQFDGRLRICCVDRANGRRVVFGAPGAPPAPVADAVVASCSIPAVFEPIRIGGREYVDGGVWSLTNMDAATAAQGTQVLCLNPTGSLHAEPLSARAALYLAARAGQQLEAAVLRRRGAHVHVICPRADAAAAMSPSLMASRPRALVAAAGYEQGLALGTSAA